ncbi:MAG: histidine kinase, partial [Microbacterium sp.]|uniref:histidine kinase n=1 Tax=Microbacterium sp. TaxID=51671 RepID=UPI0039E2D047
MPDQAPPGWRGGAFLAVAAVSIGVGVAGAPMLATLQAVAYPLAWVLTDSRRHAVLACAAIAVSVLVGFAVGLGGSASGWMSGLVTSSFSFAFAIALGLWISNIVDYGHERARLLAELTAAQAEVEALSRDRGAADERERLARDIHDTLAQTLAGLVIVAERAGRQSRAGSADAAAQSIATVERVARDALA